jgi:uncharacterized protein involved in exopolysaccharide biosynthesis
MGVIVAPVVVCALDGSIGMVAEIKFYLTLFLRRLPLFIVVTGVFTAMGVTYALLSPNVWRAEATLIQERPQIANNLVSSSGQPSTSEQLDLIEQRLMTRANLLEIAERHEVFENRAGMTPDAVVEIMRASTQFSRSQGSGQSIVLTVAFEGRTPGIAADVVGTYVTGILEENVRQRTGRAEDTLVFFQQEVDRLSLELDQRSAAILEFQNANIDALPETLNYRLDQQSSLQERIGQLNREIASLEDQRTRFTEIFEATGRLTGALEQRSPEEMELSAARIELEQARRVYAPGNPRLNALEQRVAVLEASIASAAAPPEGENAAPTGEATLFGLQMAEIDSRISFNRDEIARLQASLATLQETLERTPANTVQLQALEREYANTQALYNAAVVNLSTARTSERIETLSKGERITVLSQATPPNNPVRPNRKKIAAAGMAAGLGLSVGLIVLLEMFNRAIRRPAELTRRLGIVPLVTVPYLPSRRETMLRRARLAAAVAVVFLGVPAGLYTFHEQVMPLDRALGGVVSRLGL